MKKFSGLCILLAVVLLLQMFSVPVFAAETGENTEATVMTEAPLDPVYADRIIEYRNTHGPFTSVSQLLNISGIGQKRLAAIWVYITIGD